MGSAFRFPGEEPRPLPSGTTSDARKERCIVGSGVAFWEHRPVVKPYMAGKRVKGPQKVPGMSLSALLPPIEHIVIGIVIVQQMTMANVHCWTKDEFPRC